jgi:hypothetical protein
MRIAGQFHRRGTRLSIGMDNQQMDRAAFDELTRDLVQIFGDRLASLVAYGEPKDEAAHTLALVDRPTFTDFAKCAPRTAAWHRLGLATPLVLSRDEFRRSLDVFPLEYGEIIARHTVLAGSDPFVGVSVREADVRRGCELLAKSQLIHLREGFLETGGNPAAIARLISDSTTTFRTLLANLERLDPGGAARAGATEDLVREVAAAADTAIAEPSALLARYIAVVERLWQYVDTWR